MTCGLVLEFGPLRVCKGSLPARSSPGVYSVHSPPSVVGDPRERVSNIIASLRSMTTNLRGFSLGVFRTPGTGLPSYVTKVPGQVSENETRRNSIIVARGILRKASPNRGNGLVMDAIRSTHQHPTADLANGGVGRHYPFLGGARVMRCFHCRV